MMKILLVTLLIFSACAEKKQSNSEKQRSQAAAIFLLSSGRCLETSAPAIDGKSRTQFDFTGVNCVSTTVGDIGFVQANLKDSNNNGIVGETPNSRLAAKRDFSSTGEKKVNIEVTYILNATDSYLDVIGNGSLNEATAQVTGPTFRIRPGGITYLIEATGTEGNFDTGVVPQSSVGQIKTLCLEIHQEGAGAHMFGWSKPCAEVTDRSNYEFDQEDVLYGTKGSKLGFVLNKVTLQRVIVTSGKLGLAAQILQNP